MHPSLVFLLGLMACTFPTGGDVPCDPLEATASPVDLDTAWVGEASDGTLYAIDLEFHRTPAPEERVYVTDDLGTLVRYVAVDSGGASGNDGSGVTVVTKGVREPEPFVVSRQEGPDGVRMAMALGEGVNRDFERIVDRGEELAVLPDDAVLGVPAEIRYRDVVEFHGITEAGEHLVVLRDEVMWDFQTVRVFFGPPDALAERRADKLERALFGLGATVTFDLDGNEAVAEFPYDDDEQPLQATFTPRGTTEDLAWPADVEPDGDYLCLE